MTYHILARDLSKAFDSVVRSKLLNLCASFMIDDELRMLRILLTETTLAIRAGQTVGSIFETLMGIPQGGGLSPVFFILYLQLAMTEFHQTGIPPPDHILGSVRPE